eukprot:scaffold69462_cov36-Phaeocystis_antarctica.AAC.1
MPTRTSRSLSAVYAYQRHRAACSRGAVLYALHVRRTRTSLGCAVRTACRGTAGPDVLLRRLLLRRAPRRLDRAAARLSRRRHPGARPLLDRR